MWISGRSGGASISVLGLALGLGSRGEENVLMGCRR